MDLQEIATVGFDAGTGFEVNNSTNPDEPYWQRIEAVSLDCDVATAEDYDCEGCVCVLFLQPREDGDATVWHMTAEAAGRARFRRAVEVGS
jgi:hypothetical protein